MPVRAGEPSDAAFIVEMARLASVLEDRPLPPPDDPTLAQGLPPSPDTAVLALDHDGYPVGAAWWHLRERPLIVTPDGEQVPELVVAVTPHYRGRGVGRCLLDALAARAAEHGYGRLALNVHIRNPAARLYSHAGFVVAGKGRGPLGVAMVRQLPASRTTGEQRRTSKPADRDHRREDQSMSNPISAGHAIVAALEAHGVDRVFEVPGESFLDVLDGLHDAGIQTVVCRQEGGATYAAEADGKLTGRPGVAMVTRGPGAANAMIAIHQSWQDGTPLVLFVGLVPVGNRQRESFQEFDIRGWFGTTTKRVLVLDEPGRASEIVAEAFYSARSGRPGPVVVGLPEDVIRRPFDGAPVDPLPVSDGVAGATELRELGELLTAARRPLMMTGGNEWSPAGAATVTGWLERTGIPAITQWRADGVVPSDSPVFAGTLGYRRDGAAAVALDEADLLLAVGCVLGEIDTDGYRLRQRPDARTVIVSIDSARTGHSGPVTRHILARPDVFAAALAELDVTPSPDWKDWCQRLRAAQERSADPGPVTGEPGSPASMTAVLRELVPLLPRDAMITYGAGNHSGWPQRFFPTRTYPALLSTRNGSMGYSIPSALAACLRYPKRLVVAVSGDGEFMMNGNELATARQHGANPLVILMDNGQFGTIRAHQEGSYPGRVSGTQLVNPDFAAIGEAMGAFAARIERADQVAGAVRAAVHAVQHEDRPALLHVVVDPAVLLPAPPADPDAGGPAQT